ncbi:MAG: hypothetical protein LBC99_07180 [Spirochaetota bacterium]|jgi:hypothetical protein|nr:hypothetical protein [Spirochaetota bacterium]
MRTNTILSIATGLVVFGSGALFAQPAPKADPKQEKKVERETAEMKEARTRDYQFQVDMINLMIKNGKMEKAHGDYILKRLAAEKAFKDANPEWVKYGFHFGQPGRAMSGQKPGIHGNSPRPMPRKQQPGIRPQHEKGKRSHNPGWNQNQWGHYPRG